MSKLSLIKKEQNDSLRYLQNLKDSYADSNMFNSTFSRFPNGFYINKNINGSSFFSDTIKEPTKKDKISKLLSTSDFLKKLTTSSFEIDLPKRLFSSDADIIAIKLVNDALILWTENFVYKVPTNEKATKRIENTQNSLNVLKQYDQTIQSFFLISEFIDTEKNLVQKSIKCETISLEKDTILEIDNFLSSYFTTVFKLSKKNEFLYIGLQHSDLHFKNIFKGKDNNFFLTDIDLLKTSGYPFIDIMHFSLHFILTIENTEHYKPLKLFLEDKSYIYNKLTQYHMMKLADIWLHFYHDDYISLYIHNRIEWMHQNNTNIEDLARLHLIKEKYNL